MNIRAATLIKTTLATTIATLINTPLYFIVCLRSEGGGSLETLMAYDIQPLRAYDIRCPVEPPSSTVDEFGEIIYLNIDGMVSDHHLH